MPIREMKPLKIVFLSECGSQSISANVTDIALEPQEAAEITKLEDSNHIIMNGQRGFEIPIEMDRSLYYKAIRIMAKGMNNWRKMHGLPLIRKFGRYKY